MGLFAENPLPLTSTLGRTGLLMGGGWYLLSIQCFSALCLTTWGLFMTYPILWIVNKVIPIRMNPIDETIGADFVDHHID